MQKQNAPRPSAEGGATEGRVIHQMEKATGEAKPSISAPRKTYNKEEQLNEGRINNGNTKWR